jgi:hypothetical protein
MPKIGSQPSISPNFVLPHRERIGDLPVALGYESAGERVGRPAQVAERIRRDDPGDVDREEPGRGHRDAQPGGDRYDQPARRAVRRGVRLDELRSQVIRRSGGCRDHR